MYDPEASRTTPRRNSYDVVYLDSSSHERIVAAGLAHDDACEVARAEARMRNAGRMFLAGSERPARGEVVLIVESATIANTNRAA